LAFILPKIAGKVRKKEKRIGQIGQMGGIAMLKAKALWWAGGQALRQSFRLIQLPTTATFLFLFASLWLLTY